MEQTAMPPCAASAIAASRRVSPPAPRSPVSSNSRPPRSIRSRMSRRNSAISRTGTAAIGSGMVLWVIAKGIASARQDRGSAIDRAGKRPRHPHAKDKQQSGRDDDYRERQTAISCTTSAHLRHAIRHIDQVPQRRDKDDAAGEQKQQKDKPGAGSRRRAQQLIFAHKDRKRSDADQRQQADQKRDAPQRIDAQCTGDRVHLVAAEALPETPDREKRQRLADRMVERMEQRGKRAERPEPISKRNDAHMLDAVIGEEALRIALEDDKTCGDKDRQRAKRGQQTAGKIRSKRVLRRRHEPHDAVKRGVQ